MSERKTPSKKVERLLWGMAAGRCEKCGEVLYKHFDTIGNFAQIAHNLPVAEGTRAQYKKINPTVDVDNIDNLLLLCYKCHSEIDRICPDKYPPVVLKKIKLDFEQFVFNATDFKNAIPTIALLYSPNLHDQKMQIEKIKDAICPRKYIKHQIDLTLKNSNFNLEDQDYWEIEKQNLERDYAKKVKPLIDDYSCDCRNLSVFAIAPIPLLVYFGTLITNKLEVNVYQLKKSPEYSWKWKANEESFNYKIDYIQHSDNPDKIVLLLSLSGIIRKQEVKDILDCTNATIVEMKTDKTPSDDFLQDEEHLSKFVKCYRELKEELRNKYSSNPVIHLFAAVPVSIAIEIGRHRNPQIDLPMIVYNYQNGTYKMAITIGGETYARIN